MIKKYKYLKFLYKQAIAMEGVVRITFIHFKMF